MKQFKIFWLFLIGSLSINAQTNIICTNPVAENVIKGNYLPPNYWPASIIDGQNEIICGINSRVSTDSLKNYLEKLATFHNRNTYSDTVSTSTGVGAARRWVYSKFEQFSSGNENRLISSYLQFDWVNGLCGDGQFRDIFAVLPGLDTSDKSIIIIEGHMDSRCEDVCDINCQAHGMEDNGSGTVLVMELARVMSKYSFDRTIVFLVTVGEEQGLYGAHAFSKYAKDEGILIRAVQNNDIVGGVICGAKSSGPSCPSEGQVDSTQVRLFSNGSFTQQSRGYARYVKMLYQEKLEQIVDVPMTISIINQEDRAGRGGDHQPFRQRGFPAIRFTSAHEHGDGSGTAPDRQHSIGDILGVDTDGDTEIDSFYVDFNYLKRNAVINGLASAMSANGPKTPDMNLIDDPAQGLIVEITSETQYPEYRIGVRSSAMPTDFEYVYRFSDTLQFIVPDLQANTNYFVSVAAVDADGVMSMFSKEYLGNPDVNTAAGIIDPLPYSINCTATSVDELSPGIKDTYPVIDMFSMPNPFNQATNICVMITQPVEYKKAEIIISDILGKEVKRFEVQFNNSLNKFPFYYADYSNSVLTYSLVIDGKIITTKKLILSR